jgi:hypothetical protein
MLAPNTLLQNRYQVIRSIGHGGMGAVYLARDQRLGHTVALKETFFTEERMRRAFEREARLLAHLRHPALPKVTDHFDEDGGQFIVMEFISGEDLEILLAQRGEPFAVGQVLAWADELLKALDYLHRQDPPILHRDIKPANLKLTPQGEIILLDFGLAKGTAGQTSSVMTSRSVFGFTPNFAPLEQIQGTGTGPRSDLYALAATLYYLMTGAIPPDALTRITEVANGQADPLRAADEVNPQVPGPVAGLLMKAMAHNRDHRPASAAEMRAQLREAYPALANAGANAAAEAGRDGKGLETAMPSTIIEAAPTQDIPAAVDTAASPTAVAQTAGGQPPLELQTSPAEAPASVAVPASAEANALLALPEKRVKRMPWVAAGVAALLLAAVTFGLVASFNSNKAAADSSKAEKAAAKDDAATGAQTIPVLEQAVPAPDDSEIVTTTDAGGVKTETRTFKSHPRVARVVITTSDKTRTGQLFSVSGEVRDLPQDMLADALQSSGDSLADAANFARPTDEKSKSAVAKQAATRKSAPPTKEQGSKAMTGGTDKGASLPASNPAPANKADMSQSVEQKTTQSAESPKQRFVKGIPEKSGTQPRAKF